MQLLASHFCVPLLILSTHFAKCEKCVLILDPHFFYREPSTVTELEREVTFSKEFKLVTIDSNSYKSAIWLISRVLSESHLLPTAANFLNGTCQKLIGVVGDLSSTTANVLHNITSRANTTAVFVKTSSYHFPPIVSLEFPFFDMSPLAHSLEAVVMFLDFLNWTRIALITDGSSYYQYIAELLQNRLEKDSVREVTPNLKVMEQGMEKQVLQDFAGYNTRVAILSMERQSACLFLEEAQNHQMVWPKYGWILIEFHSDLACNFSGLIVVRDAGISGGLGGIADLQSNYASSEIMQDSITTMALAYNDTELSNNSFMGATGEVKFKNGKRLNNISLLQLNNDASVVLAKYNPASNTLDPMNISVEGPRWSTLIAVQTTSFSFAVFLVVLLTVSIVIITVDFVLYVCFRSAPEVKATSFSVSLCMLISCYLLLCFVPVLLIEASSATLVHPKAKNFLCNLLPWFSIVGVPMTLIFSTLLVKMIRLYVIFFQPEKYKKNLLSDCSLLAYILILTTPTILILVLLATTEPLENSTTEKRHHDYIEIGERCDNDHYLEWLGALVTYHLILAITLVIVTLKTSDIRKKNFQGSTSTNVFTFFTVFMTVSTLVFLISIPDSEGGSINPSDIEIIYFTDHFAIALLCQIFLFIPKLYPPLKRYLLKKSKVRSKPASSQ